MSKADTYSENKRRRERQRTVRNITVLILMVLLLAGLFVFRLLILPRIEIADMDYLEIPRAGAEPYRITITSDNCSYSSEGIIKWSPVDATLVMKDGDTQPVLYDGAYGVFVIPDKYNGCYEIDDK